MEDVACFNCFIRKATEIDGLEVDGKYIGDVPLCQVCIYPELEGTEEDREMLKEWKEYEDNELN